MCAISIPGPSVENKTPKLTNQIKAVLLFQPPEYQKPCHIKTGSAAIEIRNI